jgi:plasmid stabilization system protein ParE
VTIVFRREAQAEFDQAFDWYEQQQAELGVDFLNKIAETLTRIEALPESYEVVFGRVRRSVVEKFPYSIFYQIEADQITVLAIFHGKRDPQTWQLRS